MPTRRPNQRGAGGCSALGVRVIKGAGAMVTVQKIESHEIDAMPHSGIATTERAKLAAFT